FHQFSGSNHTPHSVSIFAHATGTVAFFDGQNGEGHTDALSVQVTGLPALKTGTMYDVWLYNDTAEHPLLLGSLALQTNMWALSYTGNGVNSGSSGQPSANLLGLGNAVRVTLEHGAVQSPVGAVVVAGVFPPVAFSHIQHLLVAFDTNPDKKGYLVGLLQQLRTLDQQVRALQYAMSRNLPNSSGCAAHNVINLLEGPSGTHSQQVIAQCAIVGITPSDARKALLGPSGWITGAADHASYALDSPDATEFIKMHAPHVVIACTDIANWLEQVDQITVAMISTYFNGNQAQQIISLVDRAINGVDINGDESIDPVAGEAGAIIAYDHGQKLATLQLAPLG
ncbi:MAG TPA: hypothetical protein VGN32_01520, partial [Ktedonobacterales bacterium]|nr:hypothetical protein [Ktedonobacterales bacterium]